MPSSFVAAVRTTPVSTLVMFTVVFGTTAPEGSVTTPEIDPTSLPHTETATSRVTTSTKSFARRMKYPPTDPCGGKAGPGYLSTADSYAGFQFPCQAVSSLAHATHPYSACRSSQ